MKPRSLLALAVFVPFTAFSLWVSWHDGALGFIPVLTAGGWSTQVFLDLVIAMCVASTVVHRDARSRGISPWPWMVAMFTVGSIGLLGYFVAREFIGRREPTAS